MEKSQKKADQDKPGKIIFRLTNKSSCANASREVWRKFFKTLGYLILQGHGFK